MPLAVMHFAGIDISVLIGDAGRLSQGVPQGKRPDE
jgi:hypothetical protein